MPQHDCSGCSRDDPIAAADTHGWGKYGLERLGRCNDHSWLVSGSCKPTTKNKSCLKTSSPVDKDILAANCSLIYLGKAYATKYLGLNLSLSLVISCWSQKTTCWRPGCYWLWWKSTRIGGPSKSLWEGGGREGGLKDSITLVHLISVIYFIYWYWNVLV